MLAISLIHSAALRQVHSLIQSEFFTDCDPVPSISISSILSFPEGHPVAAKVFLLVFSSLLFFQLSFLQ
jgi:hypothetical protein